MENMLPSSWVGFLIATLLFSPMFGAELLPNSFSDLGNEKFRVREHAQALLLDWARNHVDESLDKLYTHSQNANDPEIRARCLVILRQLVMDQYMLEGKGFVGISRDNRIIEIPGKQNPCHVVAVTGVRAETPADRAGIKINDMIVSLNGVGWTDADASTVFADQIAAMSPGTKVVLAILRDGKMINVEVILTRRPLSAEPWLFGVQDDPEAADRAAMDSYFRDWLNKRKFRG